MTPAEKAPDFPCHAAGCKAAPGATCVYVSGVNKGKPCSPHPLRLEAAYGWLSAQPEATARLAAIVTEYEADLQASVAREGLAVKALEDYKSSHPDAPPAPVHSAHYLDGWGEPVFLDEFSGTALDPTKWRVYDGTKLSYDLATVRARNVQVRDGQLHMLAKREADSGREWTSSYITTGALAGTGAPDLFSQKYGRFEVRAKLPTTATSSGGIWPAPLWMRSKGTSGEIDVCEAWGEPSTTRSDYRKGSGQWTLHQDTNHAAGTTKKSGWLTPNTSNVRLADDFHTYAVEWTPDGFTFLLDGKPVQYATLKNADLGFPVSVFDAPYHLRIQMQVGQPNYWGVPTAETADADMVIDWVRAYALPA